MFGSYNFYGFSGDDTTTEEYYEDDNVPCDSDKLPQGCYYKYCAYGSSSGQECNKKLFYVC